MRVPNKIVEEMVAEASLKMSDPNYSAVLVGGFVQTQGPAAQYISASASDLGGAEEVVNTIFHTALMAECYKRANNRSVPEMSFEILDKVAEGDRRAALKRKQPGILEYIETNIEVESIADTVILFCLAMDLVS
jgi:hypothetical protein